MTPLDHVKITVEFGHELPADLKAKLHEQIGNALSKAMGVKIPAEKLVALSAPICKHYSMEVAERTGDGVCLSVDSTTHRRMAHEMLDAMFDALEAKRSSDPDLVARLASRDDEPEEESIDTDVLLDMLADVDLGKGE